MSSLAAGLESDLRAPALRRPGVVAGARPERADDEAPLLARAAHRGLGLLCAPQRVRRRQVRAFEARVDGEASGLEALDENGFDAAVEDLRRALLRAGLRDALVPRGFALVREAARRTLGTPHYGVQLFGGRVMARAGLAELETGEGKTLTATLPASLAALAGIPVHVITANDYLVERDAEAMRPLYERLGVRVGVVLERDPERAARREAYGNDVAYATNKQIAFDYLRDRLAAGGGAPLSERLGLVPPRALGPDGPPVLRGLCFAIVDEADSVLIDDARTPLILSGPGAPADEDTVRSALELAQGLEEGEHFTVDRTRGRVLFTDRGRKGLAERGRSLAGPLAGERRREEWVGTALAAAHLYARDRHYVVREGRIEIIDQPTGRRAPDRSFEGAIQSLIEAREGVALSPQRETLSRISYQRFFGRYLRLAGMTGTAREVAQELWNVYRLRTAVVPTRLPSRRVDGDLAVFDRAEDKWRAVVERVAALHAADRPVLVGTASVESSEHLSARLEAAGLDHVVLSAAQDGEEAAVVARAGEPARITVATRMAGRGTDVKLAEGVEDRGGLAVVATEISEARRIDRQLFGRCGRQGAPGSFEQLVSLDEPLVAGGEGFWRGLLHRLPAALRRARLLPRLAQRAEERRASLARRRVLASERHLRRFLAFSGRSR